MRLLLVEDDRSLGDWLSRALGQTGFRVDWVVDGRMVRRALEETRFDALILDLGLPGLGGLQALTDLRAADQRLPVLILTARDSLSNRVDTLHAGADDFLSKPFELAELEARILALVRRSRGSDRPRLACGPLAYDTGTRRFELGRAPLTLTPREHAALFALIQRSGEPLSKREIAERVFPDASDAQWDAVEVLVYRLRKRLQDSAVRIVTLRGLGYALEDGSV